VRHVLGPVTEELGEDEWNIVAAETVINPVFPGKRLTYVTAKKAWAIPCSESKPF
jgi:hypothetical protein